MYFIFHVQEKGEILDFLRDWQCPGQGFVRKFCDENPAEGKRAQRRQGRIGEAKITWEEGERSPGVDDDAGFER